MGFVRVIITALVLLAGAQAAQAKPPTDYSQPDGGYLVYSVGTIRIGMDFSFPYHRVSEPDGTAVNDWSGLIEPKLGGMWTLRIKNPDFSGRETGHVVIRRLPPGRYTIENFAFGGQTPTAQYSWSSAKPFVIQFNISSNETTYIGSFMRSPSFGTSLQPQLGAAGFFVISNQKIRDLAIARTKRALPAGENLQVTDVDEFGNLALHSREPD